MKCKRCGKEMVISHFDGEDYYVCHDCKVKRKVHSDEASIHPTQMQKSQKKTKDRSVSLSHIDGIKGMGKECLVDLTYRMSERTLEIKPFLSRSAPYTLDVRKIIDIQYTSDWETYEKGKSVVGRAAAGSLVFGPVGAIVGGISGTGKKQKSKRHNYVIIAYISNGVEKSITFEEKTPQLGLTKMIAEIKEDANIQPPSREL